MVQFDHVLPLEEKFHFVCASLAGENSIWDCKDTEAIPPKCWGVKKNTLTKKNICTAVWHILMSMSSIKCVAMNLDSRKFIFIHIKFYLFERSLYLQALTFIIVNIHHRNMCNTSHISLDIIASKIDLRYLEVWKPNFFHVLNSLKLNIIFFKGKHWKRQHFKY